MKLICGPRWERTRIAHLGTSGGKNKNSSSVEIGVRRNKNSSSGDIGGKEQE